MTKLLKTAFFSLLFGCTFLLTSCGDECKTCTFDGDTETICPEDIDQYNAELGTGEDLSLDEIVNLIEILGGSCN